MPVLKYKDGNEWKVASKNVAYEISDMPAPTQQELHFSGDLSNWDSNGNWDWFIAKYGNKIKTERVIDYNEIFTYCQLEEIPFAINCYNNGVSSNTSSDFINYSKLKKPPIVLNDIPRNMSSMFTEGNYLEEIPDNYFDTWDFSYMKTTGSARNMFYDCYRLRKIPVDWLNNMGKYSSYSSSYFYNGFYRCFCLDKLENLPIPYIDTWTDNAFKGSFINCMRLNKLTFAQTDAKQWKKQFMDLSGYVGYGYETLSNYGMPADKQVKDNATYQALKDDPDSWTMDINYSRYNRISAVETINSLPDTSAYLATAGGTNTIRFKGAQGAKTDGGAINTMTEEEIAVATAKGWTVSFV